MARLPTSGSALATPLRVKAELRRVLIELCPDGNFNESDTDEIYWRLGQIIGQWSGEDNRLDIAPLAKIFTTVGKELGKLANILSGHETGLREIHDIAFVSQLEIILPLDPEVGSRELLIS